MNRPLPARRHRQAQATLPLAACAALLLATACGAGDAGVRSSVRMAVDTVGGVVHVRNAGEAPVWTATPVLRLGSVAGGDAEFGRLRSLVADGSGNIHVADVQAQQVLVFNPEGRRVGTIGRSGGGPGEFRNLYSLAWLGGRLAVMDPGNVRISVFSPDGEVADELRYYPMTGPVIRMHALGDDGFYAPVRPTGGSGLPYVRFTAAGAADTIPGPRAPENVPSNFMQCDRPDGGITFISVPEGPATVFGFPPGGGMVAAAWTAAYRVAFINAAGDTVRTITRERLPVAFPDSIWERAHEPLRELRTMFPGSLRCEPAALTRPQARAAFRFLTFDEAGRLWVEAAADDGGFAWDIFDTDGRLLGSFPAPPRSTAVPPYIRNNMLYQVETDDMDVQYVAVYRVGPAG